MSYIPISDNSYRTKIITVAEIRACGPCFDPVTGLNPDKKRRAKAGLISEGWTGTAKDISNLQGFRVMDRIWTIGFFLPVDIKFRIVRDVCEEVQIKPNTSIYTLMKPKELRYIHTLWDFIDGKASINDQITAYNNIQQLSYTKVNTMCLHIDGIGTRTHAFAGFMASFSEIAGVRRMPKALEIIRTYL